MPRLKIVFLIQFIRFIRLYNGTFDLYFCLPLWSIDWAWFVDCGQSNFY